MCQRLTLNEKKTIFNELKYHLQLVPNEKDVLRRNFHPKCTIHPRFGAAGCFPRRDHTSGHITQKRKLRPRSSSTTPTSKCRSPPQTIKSDVTMETAGRESPTGGGCTEGKRRRCGGGRGGNAPKKRFKLDGETGEREREMTFKARETLKPLGRFPSPCVTPAESAA